MLLQRPLSVTAYRKQRFAMPAASSGAWRGSGPTLRTWRRQWSPRPSRQPGTSNETGPVSAPSGRAWIPAPTAAPLTLPPRGAAGQRAGRRDGCSPATTCPTSVLPQRCSSSPQSRPGGTIIRVRVRGPKMVFERHAPPEVVLILKNLHSV